jgi:G3E family GTPase
MSHLLEEKSADLYRTKGLLAFKDQGDNKFLFQGVHEQIDFGPSEIPWKSDEERISKMVFIGRNLDYEALNAGLSGAVADPATAIIKMHKRA